MKNKGITLIALVITIIILLILAGVALSQLTGNGLFEKTKQAKELKEKADAMEILNTKIMEYQTYAISENEKTSLEGFKKYFEENNEIQYVNISENKKTADVKLSKYKYVFTIDDSLKISNIDGEETQEEKLPIDDELQALLKKANMSVTVEDLLNTTSITDKLPLVQQTLESDVTRSTDENGIIYYTDTRTGGIISTNSEYLDYYHLGWKAFDGDTNFPASSDVGDALNYFISYEFPEEMYVIKTKIQVTNCASRAGERKIKIQGFNNESDIWEDLTEELTYNGNNYTFPNVTINLNYNKPYKKYRVYVTGLGNYGDNDVSGVLEMQYYGMKKEDIKNNILEQASISKLTLDDMLTNPDFIKRLVDNLPLQDVISNEKLLANLPSLVAQVSESDVTRRTDESGITYYTDTRTGGIIGTNSEYSSDTYAWKAFDGNFNHPGACSKVGDALNYYVEYEFPENMYILKTKFKLSNAASRTGERRIKVQGYNNESNIWEDLTGELTYSGNMNTFPEVTIDLDCTRSYKRYRVYVTGLGNSGDNDISGVTEMQYYGKIDNKK